MTIPVKPLPAEDLDHVLAHTRELWARARGRSFFITGGTGFFGRWLLESFARANDALDLGMRAVVLTRDPAAFAQNAPHLTGRSDLELVRGDMRNFAFPQGKFAYVIHAATDTAIPPAGADPREIQGAVVDGTRRVLDFARQAGVEKLLYTSSGAVYGPQPSGLSHIAEDYPGRPDPSAPGSAYGLGKRISEELCAADAGESGYQCKLARCFAFVGPLLPLDAHFAIGNFIRDALAGGPIEVKGDGTPHRSYLYAADLAVWLWTLLFQGEGNRTYNVGSGDELSIADLAALIRDVVAPGVETRIAQARVPGEPPARYVPSVKRAELELGLKPRIALTEGIRRTAIWHGGTAPDFRPAGRAVP